MKKLLAGLFLSASVLALAACGSDEEGKNGETILKVGASTTPHAIILEQAKPILAKQGIELEIEEYTEYVLANKDLDSGDIDANYFQHIPYFESQIADNGAITRAGTCFIYIRR